MRRCARALTVVLASLLAASSVCIAQPAQQSSSPPKSPAKQGDAQTHPTPDEELQQSIDSAGNDRAALVRNLEAFLQKYPEASDIIKRLRAKGVLVLFGVDGTALQQCSILRGKTWDRIVWNFPHAGELFHNTPYCYHPPLHISNITSL